MSGPAAVAGLDRATAARRVDRAEVRFAVGSRATPQSQTWVIRSRSTDLFIGPTRARHAPARIPSGAPAQDVEIVHGWQIAAVIIISPLAVNNPARPQKPRPIYHPLPRPGRVFQAVVAYAGPDAEPLSIAAPNNAGALSLPGGGSVHVWINHVPHRAAIDRLVLRARHDLTARGDDSARRPSFLHATTDQDLPVLIDLGDIHDLRQPPVVAPAGTSLQPLKA